MPIRDRLLAVLVAVCWGVNFTAIHLSLEQFPPFLLVALRFALIAVPTVLLVPRPRVPLRWLLGYGLGFGVLQFVFLYWAMSIGMPAGLASLVLQASAPFTVVLAAAFLREKVGARQGVGLALAVAGLVGIAVHRAGLLGTAGLLPVLLTLLGGLGWAFGNISNRLARTDEPLRLTLWMSVVPPLPMLALSFLFEGPSAMGRAFSGLGTRTGLLALAGLAFTVLIATVIGSGIWTALMSRHPSSTVAPFSMLVPVAGIAASWLLLHERTPVVEVACGVVVVLGVLVASRPPRRGDGPASDTGADVETEVDPQPVASTNGCTVAAPA